MEYTNLYNVSSPHDIKMRQRDYQIKNLVNQIELYLHKNIPIDGDYIWVSLQGECYPKDIRDVVCDVYTKNGWSKVTHMTSSENGERPGLTTFRLYF